MAVVAKRTIMSLYSDESIYSHQVRIVLAEKGITTEIYAVTPHTNIAELATINPYEVVPTLVDRDLILWDSQIIMEYLDERFPHPPLLPVYPVARAETRKMLFRIKHDWYPLLHTIEDNNDETAVAEAREQLLESLTQLTPIFKSKTYFLSDEFSMLDCCVAPLLWRLPRLNIELPSSADPIHEYAKRVFDRSSFQTSLTDRERDLQAA